MNIESTKIDEGLLTKLTGDPFADIGGFVWAEMVRRNPSYPPLKIIEEVARIFIYNWDQKLHSFFANSNITHNSVSGKKEKSLQAVLTYFKGLIDENSELVVKKLGYCRLTGAKTVLFSADRCNAVLIGSGGLSNFHHGLGSGCLVSKEIIMRAFVMPLGANQVGAMPSIIISNDEDLTSKFVKENVRIHLASIGLGKFGLHKASVGNSTNALFNFADRCISEIDTIDEQKSITLNLFHFSNFVNGPALQQYTLPEPIFKFHEECLRYFNSEWKAFINAHYRTDIKKKGKDSTEIENESIETYPNSVLNVLIKGDSISKIVRNWIQKGKYLSFAIVTSYQINIRKMDKKSIEALKRVASFVVSHRNDDAIEKTISVLNSAKNQRIVRNTLLKLVAENYESGNEDPLIRLDDVEYLFPEGFSWIEIRDLLLIGIYEHLHQSNKNIKVEILQDTDESDETND